MSETDIYLMAVRIAGDIARECPNKQEVDRLIAMLSRLVYIREFNNSCQLPPSLIHPSPQTLTHPVD